VRTLCAGALIAFALAMPAWSASGPWERSWGRLFKTKKLTKTYLTAWQLGWPGCSERR